MSFDNIGFEELFGRISSPQTAARFKFLRKATPEDLAKAFQQQFNDFADKDAHQKLPTSNDT